MNQDLAMIFNGDEAERLVVNPDNDVTPEKVMAALYDEMQRSMQQSEDASQLLAEESPCPNFMSFKEPDNNAVLSPPKIEPIDTSTLITAECTLTNENEVKCVTIPDNWQIAILEANGVVSHSAEPLITSDQGEYRLWECPKCTALFREKELCHNHISNAHDFSCSFCCEPFNEKSAFEDHIVVHISQFDRTEDVPPQETSIPVETDTIDANCFDELFRSSKKRKISSNSHTVVKSGKNIVSNNNSTADESSSQSFTENSATSRKSIKLVQENGDTNRHSRFRCDTCGKQCPTQHSFMMHLSKMHPEISTYKFVCNICNKGFTSKQNLANHQAQQHRSVQKPKNFRCHNCSQRFFTAEQLKQHNHEEMHPFPCDFCGERFKMSAGLNKHIKVRHPNVREFPCIECGKSFRSKMYLEVHVSEAHASERKKCQYCPKTYKSLEALMSHIQEVHDKEEQKNYDCDYCSETFSNSRDLKRHMEVHLLSIQTHECTICNTTFPSSVELKCHNEETHDAAAQDTLDPTYDCDWCSRSFSHKDNLKIHIRVHHGPMYNEGKIESG